MVFLSCLSTLGPFFSFLVTWPFRAQDTFRPLMPSDILCSRCKGRFPPSHFVGAHKKAVKHCAGCRGISSPGVTAPPTPSMQTPPSAHMRHLSCSPRSLPHFSRSRSDSSSPRPSAEAALEGQILNRLDKHLDARFNLLLEKLRPAASSPPPPSLLGPTLTAAASLSPPPNTVGESSPLSSSRCFPWVPPNVVKLVAQDKLPAEQLVKLHNPKSCVTRDPPQASGLVFEGGQLTLAKDLTSQRTSSFVKAIPNLAALTHVWLIYTGIRVCSTQNPILHEALLSHLLNLIEFDSLFTWRAVVDYHLSVCRIRFGTGIVHEWALTDQQIHSTVLAPFLKAPSFAQPASASSFRPELSQVPRAKAMASAKLPPNSTPAPTSLADASTQALSVTDALDHTPASTVAAPMQWLDAQTSKAPRPTPPQSPRKVTNLVTTAPFPSNTFVINSMLRCRSLPPPSARLRSQPPPSASLPSPWYFTTYPANVPHNVQSAPLPSACQRSLQPQTASTRSTPPLGVRSAPLPSASRSLPPSSALPQVGPPSTTQPALLSSAAISLPSTGIVDMTPACASTLLASLLKGSPPPPRPNTWCKHPIFNAADVPATIGSLSLQHWSHFLDLYPDQAFAAQLRRALQHGVKLGYTSPLCNASRLEVANLPMNNTDVLHLCREIEAQVLEGRLQPVTDPIGINLVCSLVGVVPKPHSNKRRTIYHLLHPRKPGKRLPSVNNGVDPSFVTLRYESLDVLMDFIRDHPSASLWKANLEDAFRHIVVAKTDARLMGIHFDSQYYQECALAFGGRSSPFLFNLFAKFLHWLTSFVLTAVSPSSTSHSDVSHYSTTSLVRLPPLPTPASLSRPSAYPPPHLGFASAKGRPSGAQLDSKSWGSSSTPSPKRHPSPLSVVVKSSSSADVWWTADGPHSSNCSKLLATSIKAHYKAPFSRRISRATRDELSWWIDTLKLWDGVSLLQPSPLVVEHIWTDASKRSIGAHLGTMDNPVAVFSHKLSRRHRKKDICFLEALAVLEALCRFAPTWSGPRHVVVHVDNENVEYGLRKGSIRDPSTQVLFRAIFALCLQKHIELVPVHVSSAENILADALSRQRFAFIQQQYLQAYSLLPFKVNLDPSRPPPSSRPSASPPQLPSSSGMALLPAHEPAPQPCALTPPLPPLVDAQPSLP
ncbi:uncharacterized protein UTRI_04921 [Ustilago trichophora]|uniref:Reverse transcriptase RNase H-like domain-containing protein n=1 Tax=Ustilago trichophora TaxID=86804 RepID=A0A5C3ECX0_9BASI|nr:uncharacterized protein UTRI_04921 [Ustilago trichophora]